ncbi:T9SS type A sorting domain-containing protein, partial [bacterium]|nr:T9SS type A sorting domain-containing protein [bacterium]
RGGTEIRWGLGRAGDALVEVFDVTGARVFVEARNGAAAGSHVTRWRARDAAGRPLPSGVYTIRVTTARDILTGKAVRLR